MTVPLDQLLALLQQLTAEQLGRLSPAERRVLGDLLREGAYQTSIEKARLDGEDAVDRPDPWTIANGAMGAIAFAAGALDIYLAGIATAIGWVAMAAGWAGLATAAPPEQARTGRSLERARHRADLEARVRDLERAIARL